MSSNFSALQARLLDKAVLQSVLLELTYRCNLDCSFCYNDLALQGRPLSLQQYESLLDELAEMQVVHLVLSGGEPLASPVFWQLGRRGRDLGFVVRVKSNGHALRRSVAERLRDEIDPYVVDISLHGACAATHDRQTRVVGSFDRLMENFAHLRACGVRVNLNTTVTRWNEDEIEGMLELAESFDLPINFDPVVTPRDNGDRQPLDISPTEGGVDRLMDILRARARRRAANGSGPPAAQVGQHNDVTTQSSPGHNCGTGTTTLTIDPFGNVYPCVQWRRPVGNLHDHGVREIWSGSGSLREIRELNRAAGAMVNDIEGGRRLGFCLGLAEQLTGSPLGIYPQAELRRKAALRAADGAAD